MSKSKYNCSYCLAYFIATALLLTIIQPPFRSFYLAWVAYVPLIIVTIQSENKKSLYFCSWLVAFVYWLVNIYWMGYVTISGWIVFCAYTALLWPVLIITLRFLYHKKVPLIISCAVLIVGTERLQGLLLGGFYWRHLSHSQYKFTTLIQIADIFGAAGISFLIAMVNGFLAELFIRKQKIRKLLWIKVFIVIALITGTLLYGGWRIKQGRDVIEQGPVIGVVQSNLPQDVKTTESFEESKKSFQEHLSLSRKCADAGAVLIAWPETIIAGTMDKGIWPNLVYPEEPIYYHKQLCEHSKEGAYLLVGAPGGNVEYLDIVDEQGNLKYDIKHDKFNSAFLYEPRGDQAVENYDKIHLVPFGEYIPFRNIIPGIYNVFMHFTPYDFDYTLTPGDDFTIFEINDQKANFKHKFGVMICYESTIPKIARGFAIDEGKKQVDWLLNISNDGWFVRFKDEKVMPSTELQQHVIAGVFRAVENRVSIIRSVNTGVSCLVDSMGDIKDSFKEGDLPERAFDRQGIDGYFVDYVPVDPRITFFSKFGQWLDNSCSVIVFFTLILLIIGLFFRNKDRRKVSNGK